jgi:hypothetical protein
MHRAYPFDTLCGAIGYWMSIFAFSDAETGPEPRVGSVWSPWADVFPFRREASVSVFRASRTRVVGRVEDSFFDN